MQWTDTGVVLSARKHGETSAILHLLTERHGRHAGLVRGGGGRRLRSVLQPGNELQVTWRARLSENLGTFTVEPLRARVADVLHDPARLAAFAAATETIDAALPERAPDVEGYRQFCALLDAIAGDDDWPVAYVRWEVGLLAGLGFGLDLSGARAQPSGQRPAGWPGQWIASHRTAEVRAGLPFDGAGDRWLEVPPFVAGHAPPVDPAERRKAVLTALLLTGAFLPTAIGDHKPRLGARARLVERLARPNP